MLSRRDTPIPIIGALKAQLVEEVIIKRHMPKIGLGLLAVMLLVVIGIVIYMRNAPVEDVWVFELQDASPAEPRKSDHINSTPAIESPTHNVDTTESSDHDADVDAGTVVDSGPAATDSTVDSEK
ncbi:hypothetical protein C6502_22130 [Candidatus Poribacteria bacterium]|nr:MAG: hypothetical protein C6502_22130 [Candidatus Poribacteria bacterium]